MRDSRHLLERIGVVAFFVLAAASCSVPRPSEQWLRLQRHDLSASKAALTSRHPSNPEPAAPATLDELIWSKLHGSDPEFHVTHPRVDQFVKDFSTRSRRSYRLALERSGRYVPDMITILEEEGAPAELAYLPLIESGFRTGAVSPRGAVGQWQFVRNTGKRYGLRIDWYVDERRDPLRSTRAAARYLRTLHEMFGSWHLALAAYNTGEMRVTRVINRRGAETFWEMMENRYLHRETRAFVPLFLAALQIARDPEAYGFDPPRWKRVEHDLVHITRSLSLREIAEMTGTSTAELKRLNPALIRSVTPPDPAGYPVRLPSGTEDRFRLAYSRMMRSREIAPELAGPAGTYRIRAGDTPAMIARRFGISVNDLMYANGWADARRIQAGELAHIPGLEPEPSDLTMAGGTYRIRPGDTPSTIAERFGIATRELMRANGWKNARNIHAGRIARIPGAAEAAKTPAEIASVGPPASRAAGVTYRIRAGDTPQTIASRFEVPVKALMHANGWHDARRIQAGGVARIPDVPAAGPHATAAHPGTAANDLTYRVRRGDTPGLIAERFSVSLAALMATNGWTDPRRIRAGDTARIPSPTPSNSSLHLASAGSSAPESSN